MKLSTRVIGIHNIVEHQAMLQPAAPALITLSGTLSYAELLEQSTRLAGQLMQIEVGPERMVGLCLDRSADMIIALLAIWKAGGVVVPLDPADPEARLEYILANTALGFIIGNASTIRRLPEHHARTLVLEELHRQPDLGVLPPFDIELGHAAYVTYVSDASGYPRGVVLEHGNLLPLLEWAQQHFSVAQCRRVFAANTLNSGLWLLEFVLAFATGGAIVLAGSLNDLFLAASAHEPSMIVTSPALLEELVRPGALPQSVQQLVLCGDKLSAQVAYTIYQTTNVQQITMCWGAPETAFVSTCYMVPKALKPNFPIGRPINGHIVQVLDAQLQPVTPGMSGELWCSGNGIARGYLDRPECMQTNFAVNRLDSTTPMYRSGDIAVVGYDGEIRCIARKDPRVDIMDTRVDLREIESIMRRSPLVTDAAVVLRETPVGKSLALFVVAGNFDLLSLSAAQQFLRRYLPKHLLPSTLTILEQLPLDDEGNLDRLALQRLARRRPLLNVPYEAPRNQIERAVASIFAEILGLDSVGIYDDFLQLGGKTSMVSELMKRLQNRFALHIRQMQERGCGRALLTVFWEHPAVANFAAFFAEGASVARRPVSEIRCLQLGSPDRPPLFLLHGVVDGEGFYVWNVARALGPEQTVYTMAPHGEGGADIPKTIELMASDYLAQIRRIQPHGPYHFAGYCNGAVVSYEIARMLETAGEEVKTLLLVAAPGHTVPYAKLERLMQRWQKTFTIDANLALSCFVAVCRMMTSLKKQLRTGIHLPAFLVQAFASNKTYDASGARSNQERISPQYRKRVKALNFALEAYVPKQYNGPVTLIFGKDDAYAKDYTPFQDWARVAPKLRACAVSGDHYFIEEQPELLLEYFQL